jgi:hypothetical protein
LVTLVAELAEGQLCRVQGVRGDEAVTFRAVGLVPDNVVGKVAAAREHRDPGLGSRTLQFDRAESDKAAEDGDDLGAGVSVTTSSTPTQIRAELSSARQGRLPLRSRWRLCIGNDLINTHTNSRRTIVGTTRPSAASIALAAPLACHSSSHVR